MEICSVNFEQLVVMEVRRGLEALVGQWGVGQEGGELAPGLLFALQVSQQGVRVWLWKLWKYKIVEG